MKILHDHGAKQMSALEPDQFESVLAETKIEETDPLD